MLFYTDFCNLVNINIIKRKMKLISLHIYKWQQANPLLLAFATDINDGVKRRSLPKGDEKQFLID